MLDRWAASTRGTLTAGGGNHHKYLRATSTYFLRFPVASCVIEVSSPKHPSGYREGCYTLKPISSEGGLGLQQRAPAVCFAPQVFVGMSQQESRCPVLDFLSHSEVVWDEELQQLDGEMYDPLECKQAMFTVPIMSNSDIEGVFDELSSQVVWDEESRQEVESHDSILNLLAHGECLIAMDDKPIAELVSFKAPIVTNDDEGELFDGKNCTDVIWDEEPHHGFDSHGLLQKHAEAIDNQMQGKQEVSVEILCESVLWDAIPADIDMHQGLLQKLAQSGDYCDERKLLACCKQCMADELNQDRDTPFLLGLGMDHVDEMSASPSSLSMKEDLPSVPETPGSLLQQVAWDRKHFDYEMRKSIAEIVLEDVLFDVGSSLLSVDSCMQVSDQVCMSELFIDSYLMELKYKKAYISISQWDPGILDYVTRRLASRREFFAGILLRELKPYELYAKGISLKRTIYMGFIAFCNSVNQIMIHEENSPSGFSPCSQVTLLALEDIPGWKYDGFNPRENEQLKLYMITLIQWDLGPVEWYKSNYLCPADPRLVESGIDSCLFKQSVMLKDSLFFDMKYYLALQLWRYISWCIACYGAWAGQEMESDYKDLVIFDGEQAVCGGAHYVASGVALWRRNALSPGNSDTKATSIFNKILSWNRDGFSLGES